MLLYQALVLAVIQGATELFPVSSLGHGVIVPALLDWTIDERGATFLPFMVLLHFGTATALLAYFWRDWWSLARGIAGLDGATRRTEAGRMIGLIVVATIPAVILGATLEPLFRRLFGSPQIAAGFLIANGVLLLAGERLRGRTPSAPRALAALGVMDALAIGIWQCLALLPGLSRSGATITGALRRGIDHASAAHFSFLIATPLIFGATVKEVPKLLHAGVPAGVFEVSAVAAVVSGLVAAASTTFLMRYFRSHEKWALNPFAYYCLGAGAISVIVLAAR